MGKGIIFYRGLVTVLVVAAWATAGGAGQAPTRPTSSPALPRPDPRMWAERNLEVLRQAKDVREPGEGEIDLYSALGMSASFNRMLVRDEYAGKVLAIADEALKRENDPARRAMIQSAIGFLRQPTEERMLRQFIRIPADEPIDWADTFNMATDIAAMSSMSGYDELAQKSLERMDRASREAGKWGSLGLSYHYLADYEWRRHRNDRAAMYADRMMGILREHMVFQDLNRGNSDAVQPALAAGLLLDLGRVRDVDELVARAEGAAKAQMLMGKAEALVTRDKAEEARRVIEAELKPLAPEVAGRLLAALEGRAEDVTPKGAAAAPSSAPWKRGPRPRKEPTELYVTNAITSIAQYHARRGDVERAAGLMDTVGPLRVGPLRAYEWSRLADLAHRAGHDEGARKAIEHGLETLANGQISGEQYQQIAALAQEAMEVGAYPLASGLVAEGYAGSRFRYELGVAYRRRGDLARARALWTEAMELARHDTGGSTMALIAVELWQLGQRKRAERVLLEARQFIHGEDFGFGGTWDVVKAAMRMGGPQMLERLWASGSPSDKLILSIVATNVGMSDEPFPQDAE